MFLFSSDDKKNLFEWVQDPYGTLSKDTKVGKIKLSNNYYTADTIYACLTNGDGDCSGDTVSFASKVRNDWQCSEFLSDNPLYNISTAETTYIAPANNEKTTITYAISPLPETVVPECACKNWYITATGKDESNYYTSNIGCELSSEKSLSLPPNNEKNKKYTISAYLNSTRKK